MSDDLLGAVRLLKDFSGKRLGTRIAELEGSLAASSFDPSVGVLRSDSLRALLTSAFLIKEASAQIDTLIHALGILNLIPLLLRPSERVEYVSLGAGNTGRAFDLETNERIAEFKFIKWQGRSETIRQNSLFKDFYFLAEHDTTKSKHLYVTNTDHPIRFLSGGRAISSVLSHNGKLRKAFQAQFGDRYKKVGEYFMDRRDRIAIEDVSPLLSTIIGR